MTDYASPFLAKLGATATDVMLAAVTAWQLQESGGRVTGNNPWNLHIGPKCSPKAGAGVPGFRPSQKLRSKTIPGLLGNRYAGSGDQNVAIFKTLADGGIACAANLLYWGQQFGYGRVVAAARAGDPVAFLNALAASSWSAGRYGTRNGGPNALLAIYRRLAPATPKPAPTPAKEAPVSERDRLVAAIRKIANDDDYLSKYSARLAEYSARLASLDGAPLPAGLAIDAPTTPPVLVIPPTDHPSGWSSDPQVAGIQLCTAAGVTMTHTDGGGISIDSAELLAKTADKPAIREALTVLGFFGTTGSNPAIDYSARAKFYDTDPNGNEQPNVPNVWAAYLETLA